MAVDGARVTMGRDATNDVVIDDPQASRFHAAIEVTGRLTWVVDLGSRNGVRLNGRRVSAKSTIAHGDLLTIGSTDLRYTERSGGWRESQLTVAPRPH